MSKLLSFGSSAPTKNLVGMSIQSAGSHLDALRAAGSTVRVLTPGSMATMDFRTNRVNVTVDAAGKIVSVHMG